MIIESCPLYQFEIATTYQGKSTDFYIHSPDSTSYQADIILKPYDYINCWGCILTEHGLPIAFATITLVAIYCHASTPKPSILCSTHSYENGYYECSAIHIGAACYFLAIQSASINKLILLTSSCNHISESDVLPCKEMIWQQLSTIII